MRMSRIAVISEHASPLALAGGVDSGGQNVYVAHVAARLARDGHHVDVFTRREHASQPDIVRWRRNARIVHLRCGPVRAMPKEEMIEYIEEFADGFHRHCMKRPRYDIVHANFFMSAWSALSATKAFGIPLVTTFHALGRVRRLFQGDADRFPDRRFEMEDEVIAASDRIIAECPQDREDLLSLYQANPAKIDVVPCGFDPSEIGPVERDIARARLRWPRDRFIILQLGRLVPRKGIDDVIRAAAGLKHQHGIDAKLYIVGGETADPDPVATPEIGRLAALAATLGVDESVEFVGRRSRDELSLYYSASD